jgi:hypothetical protein
MAEQSSPRRFSKKRFFQRVSYEPHPGQQAIHDSKARRRIVACGVRWGKTMCAAMEGLAAAMEPREQSIGWVVAPTYDLADRVFQRIVMIAAGHLRHRIVSLKESERRLVLRNFGGGLSEIRAKSADNPVSLLGEGLDWLIIDEAARLKHTIWEGHLSQRLLDRRESWALLISTPRGKGWFYDLFRRGQHADDEDYESWNHPSWTSPHLDRALIDEERGKISERAFRQEYAGEFLEGSGQVFRNVRERALGEWQAPKPGEHYFIGLDLAKVDDYTVITVMNRARQVCHVDRFHRLDWNLQVSRIQATANRYNQASILIDSTGVGEPIYESLRAARCHVDPYPFTAKSKTDLVNYLALAFEQGDVTLPRVDLFPEMVEEIEAFEYSVTDAGGVRTGAPSGVHDDCVISLGLALLHVKRRVAVVPRFFCTDDLSFLGRLGF